MKSILFVLLIACSFTCFAQKSTHSVVFAVRELSSTEASKLDKKHEEKVSVEYASNVKVNKKMTMHELYSHLIHIKKFKGDKNAFEKIKRTFALLQNHGQKKTLTASNEFFVYACGGCGCSTPGKAGYAVGTGNSWWCACCD